MNRRDVARYLGKSIATVRRAEGEYLHPRRDRRGMLHFDAGEVGRLREAIERGEVRLCGEKFSRQLLDARHATRDGAACNLHAEIARLRRESEELRTIGTAALELFLAACPDMHLSRLDVATLNAFGAALAKRLGD